MNRSYDKNDYSMLCQWWNGHGWTPPPITSLPRGIVIDDAAAGFLFLDPASDIAVLEFIVTNPQNTPRQSLCAIAELVATCENIAKQMERRGLFTSCVQDSLARFFQDFGYQAEASKAHHLIKTWEQ